MIAAIVLCFLWGSIGFARAKGLIVTASDYLTPVLYALVTSLAASVLDYSVDYILATILIVSASTFFWIRGPIWFPKLTAGGVKAMYLLPFLFLFEILLMVIPVLILDTTVYKLSLKLTPSQQIIADTTLAGLLGAAVGYRLSAGF